MVFEHYAQRLLNPFRGAMHTLRHESAEAVTVDGVHWDIYVANTSLLPDSRRAHRGQLSEIRYGTWSQTAGLRRGRLYPSEDFRRLEALGTILFEHLTQVHQQVPFAFKDQFELWLLDNASQPLALLDSALDNNALKFDLAIDWRAGIAARSSSGQQDSAPNGRAANSQTCFVSGVSDAPLYPQLSGPLTTLGAMIGLMLGSWLEGRCADRAA
jgi:hypothetical protein